MEKLTMEKLTKEVMRRATEEYRHWPTGTPCLEHLLVIAYNLGQEHREEQLKEAHQLGLWP